MIESHTFMKSRKFLYQWTIKNFTDYFDFASSEKSHNIRSSMFDIDGHKECQFYLEMIFSSKSVECSFKLKPCTERLQLACELSVLTKLPLPRNNFFHGKFKTIKVKIFWDGSKYYINELPKLSVLFKDLFDRQSQLFPDNNFKVQCNLTLYDEDITVSQISIQRKHQTITDNFKELLNSQSGSDVVCEVDDQEFYVHKTILMARSPVLSAMFNNDMIENKSNRVKIEDISSSIFELMIHFIYTDVVKVKLDLETGIDLLKAACKYQLEGLKALCETELYNLLTIKNVIDLLVLAEIYNLSNFINYIKNFIKIYQREIQNNINPKHFLKYSHHLPLFFTNENEN